MSTATTLSLNDRMTSRLARIEQAFARLNKAAAAVDRTTERIVPTGEAATGRMREMGDRQAAIWERSGRAVKKTSDKLDEFNNKQNRLSDGAGRLEGIWGRIGGAIKGAMALLGVRQLVSFIGKANELFNKSFQYDVQLATVMTNAGASQADFDRVRASAIDYDVAPAYQGAGMVGGMAELGTYLKDANALEAMIPTLANYAAGMGGVDISPEQMVQYATDLGKALDGTYDGLQKKGFVLTDAQKKIIELGSDMERVKVITDVIAQSWDGLAEAYSNTPEGKQVAFNNTLEDTAELISGQLMPAQMGLWDQITAFLENPAAQAFITGFVGGISLVIQTLTMLTSVLSGVATWVQANWAIIQPILAAIAIVWISMMIAKLWAVLPPLYAQAAAWLTINWPILLIIAAVALLIASLASLGVSFSDVTAFIGGLLGGLYAFIYNIIADLWNLIAVFAEFFANVFNDPIGSIGRLFTGLATFILGILESLASAIDAIFGSNLAGAVSGWIDGVQSWADEKFGKAQVTIARMEKLDTAQTAGQWGAAGRSFGEGITDTLAGLDGIGAFDIPAVGGMDIDDIDHVGSVGKIDSDINLAEEDLRLLKDMAEYKYVQNFVTLTPQIAIDAKISEKVDLDELTNEVETRFIQKIEESAEGVYT